MEQLGEFCVQKLTKFKVIFDLFTVCVYFIQQQNCKLYYIYLMIISETQSKTEHYSCDSAKFKAPADFSHHAILFFDIVLKHFLLSLYFRLPPLYTRHNCWVRRNFEKYFASWLLLLDSPIALILYAPHQKLKSSGLGIRKIGV